MIHPEETIPRLLARAPHLRPVLDRYGLRGCGGATGPDETLAFFAAAHGVELDRLLRELNAAPAKAPPAPSAPGLTDALYRPFFLGGLAFALVPGVILGLYVMGRAWAGGSLVSPPINLINAHAHAMVAGFAGMFIMGFGYQALPRFKHASLWRPKLALFSFVLMALGVSARVAGEMLALDMSGPVFSFGGPWLALALAGSGLETVALALFALILWRTCAVAGAGWAAYDRYVFAAAGWLVLGSLAAGVHLAAITTADGFGTLIPRIAALQEPLRMVQLLGGATILILGVMQRFLPPVFGFADPGQRAMKFWFWPLNLGLAVMVTGFGWSMAAKRGLAAAPLSVATLQTMYWLALLVFAVSVLGVLTGFRPWRTPAGRDRSIPFVRAAHGWLAVALVLWLLEPVYISLLGYFGHGYHGAVRHTLTLGFIAQMIVAVSLKVVPTLRGINPAMLGRKRAVLWLLNLAVALRLAGETALDYHTAAFVVLGAGSALAALALLLWGAHIGGLLIRARPADVIAPATELNARANVAAILARWPHTIEVFAWHGFGLLKNPVARNTLARAVSLEQACALKGVNLDALLADLRRATGAAPPSPPPVAPVAAIDPGRSVADVARAYPRTVPVFSRLGLDACCGGEESVARAASHNGYALEDVMKQLQEAIAHDKA